MSVDQLNALISGYTDLKSYFEGVRGSIDGKIAELVAAKNNLPSALHNLLYVDQVNGSDENTGKFESPVRTLKHAVERLTPVMGRSDIYLQSDYDMGSEIINIQHGRVIRIANSTAGLNAPRARLIPRVFNSDGADKMSGFLIGGQTQGESIEFRRLEIQWPDDPGITGTAYGINLVTAYSSTGGAYFAVSLTDSVITTGSKPIGALINPGGRQVDLAAVPGQYATAFAGHWVRNLSAGSTPDQARALGVSCDLTSL